MGYRIQEALLKAYAVFTSCMDAGRSWPSSADVHEVTRRSKPTGDQHERGK
ncbi:hypothetical protein BCL50_3481 [Mycolicibacterium litorale]|nr:hypothetical protein BCL50_3481 [Mycolicibacterium litorale]